MDALRARFGPLPVWIWLALITALGLAYYIIQRRRNPAAASTADAAGAGQVPQEVEQSTTTVSTTVPLEGPEPVVPPVPEQEEPEEPEPTSNWPGGRQPLPVHPNKPTHHGQHRHVRPPARHMPPRSRPVPAGRMRRLPPRKGPQPRKIGPPARV